MMKKLSAVLALILLALILSSCGGSIDRHVKIAVMGDSGKFNNDYIEGIEQAITDLRNDYSDSNYTFEYEIYDDGGEYTKGANIIEQLCEDDSITAVIASNNRDINKTAAHMFNEKGKLFIVPYSVSDSMFDNDYFDTVFSITYSKYNIGEILCDVASASGKERWAVCVDNDEASVAELSGFLRPSSKTAEGHVKLVDCTSFARLEENPEKIFRIWKALGVEGVVLLSSENRIKELELMKNALPDLMYMGDSTFDNSRLLSEDNSADELMNGFVMACDFPAPPETVPEKKEKSDRLRSIFSEKNGRAPDLWYYHAYNMIRMIGDTAAKKNIFISKFLALALHIEGYEGIREKFVFTDDGLLKTDVKQYFLYAENGMGYLRMIEAGGEHQ